MTTHDTIIIGAGQSALATAYYLRRQKLDFLLLDEQSTPGGAWLHAWKSLKLFSPGDHSSLPGWLMPYKGYPTRDEVIDYLTRYEERYQFPVHRPVTVEAVEKEEDTFLLQTNVGEYRCRALISATGTWKKPFIPEYPGNDDFEGRQLHSAHYSGPGEFAGQRVLIVGGGNSGAQILADVSQVADTTWATLEEPNFLPDDVDGRFLFHLATARYKANLEGKPEPEGPNLAVGLSSIVMVDSVKQARERDVLHAVRPMERLTATGAIWPDGNEKPFDTIIWCTGFKAAVDHLKPLGIVGDKNRIAVKRTQATGIDGLWLVGYGNWTGYASATLIGVGRTAKSTAQAVAKYLEQ